VRERIVATYSNRIALIRNSTGRSTPDARLGDPSSDFLGLMAAEKEGGVQKRRGAENERIKKTHQGGSALVGFVYAIW
jgi:hypothetical protein